MCCGIKVIYFCKVQRILTLETILKFGDNSTINMLRIRCI